MIPYITPQNDYLIGPNGEELRNLISQVLKNKNDIAAIIEGNIVLGELGIKVVGQLEKASQLPDPVTYSGDYGDAYLIGTEEPYKFYIFTRPFEGQSAPQWFNLGEFPVPGPRGEKGEKGDKGDQGEPGQGIYSGTQANGFPKDATAGAVFIDVQTGYIWRKSSSNAWIKYKDITGPAGPIGPVGPRGEKGERGVQGEQGIQGEPAFSITWKGVISNLDDLPDPTTTPRNYGYLYKPGSISLARPYIIVQDQLGDLVWAQINTLGGVATIVTQNGGIITELNIDEYITADEVNAAIANFIEKPTTNGALVNTDGAISTIAVSTSATGGAIPQRDSNGRILLPKTINNPNQALNCYSAKAILGINYLANFNASTVSRRYNFSTQTTFGWGPGAESGIGVVGLLFDYLYDESSEARQLDTNAHVRFINCTREPETVKIINAIKTRSQTTPLQDTALATDKATISYEDGTTTDNKTLIITLQPKSSIAMDSRVNTSNGVTYTQHFIY